MSDYLLSISKRDDLPERELAISEALDDVNWRCHGIVSSWAYPVEFLMWLEERGYTVVKIGDAAEGEEIMTDIECNDG